MPKLEKILDSNVKIIDNAKDKIPILQAEKVYAIIEDDITTCCRAKKIGIKGIFFRNTASNKNNTKEIIEVNNWGEIYRYLKPVDKL